MVLFSTQTQEIFGLGKYHDKSAMFAAIDAIKFPGAGSDLGKALERTRTRTFNFSKANVSRIIVVLTDGKAKDEVKKPSTALRKLGVHILLVEVGDNLDPSQLELVASGPRNAHIFDFQSLQKLLARINRELCKGGLVLSSRRSFQ